MPNEYITLLSAAAGALIAFLGVYFTNHQNTARLRMQIDNEARIKKADLLRARGEELYELTDRWTRNLFTHYMMQQGVIKGEVTPDAALDFQIKQGEKSPFNFARIEMLIDVYFPDIRAEYDEVIERRSQINVTFLLHERASKSVAKDGIKFLSQFRQQEMEVDKAAEKLKREVLDQIRSI